MRKKVACIIPAYNEEKHITSVIEAAISSELIDEVVVVDDGSEDNTSEVSKKAGARVIIKPANKGKGAALETGIAEVEADIFLFLDADLIGLKSSHIEELIKPLLYESRPIMTMGKFSGGRLPTDLSQMIAPGITGQRAITKELATNLPGLTKYGFAVEVAINDFARSLGYEIRYVKMENVSQVMKEEKIGMIKGFIYRLEMYFDILKYYFKRILKV